MTVRRTAPIERGAPARTSSAGGIRMSSGLILESSLLALLVLSLQESFRAGWGAAWRASLVMACALAGMLLLDRITEWARLGLPLLVSLGALFVIGQSGAMAVAWLLPGISGRSVSPGTLLALSAGTAWAFANHADPAERSWSLALSVTAAGLIVWKATTTFLVASQGLVDPALNAAQLGRWLLLLVLFGGIVIAATTDHARSRRMGYGILLVLAVGLVRGLV